MSQYYGLVNRITISAFAAILLIAAIVTPRLYGRIGAAKAAALRNAVVTVNSASYFAGVPVARGSIASAFGTNLTTGTASALTLPLPTNLNGTTLTITDSAGNVIPAQLLFVSP